MPNPFALTEYQQDKAFGGTKYAGLQLLERFGCFKTIPALYSPGFSVYDRLMAGPLYLWLQEAYHWRDAIMASYQATLAGEEIDRTTMAAAKAFLGIEQVFAADTVVKPLRHQMRQALANEEEVITAVHHFAQRGDFSYLFRSSADIEDEEDNTAGLFITTFDTKNMLRTKTQTLDALVQFYSANLQVLLFAGRKARLNFVANPYLECTAGGVGLSSFDDEGNHHLEIADIPMKICTYGQTFMNIVMGKSGSWKISAINRLDGASYQIQGVPSYASYEQITQALDALDSLEQRCEERLNIEFLFQQQKTNPTFLQLRRYRPKFAQEVITENEFAEANHKTSIVLGSGSFQGPVYTLHYPVDIDSDGIKIIRTSECIEYLRHLDTDNPNGYAVVDEQGLTQGEFTTLLGVFSLREPRMDFIRRICPHVRVFINKSEWYSRGGHDAINMATDSAAPFYLSIPGFNFKDGAIAEFKSDGMKGVVYL